MKTEKLHFSNRLGVTVEYLASCDFLTRFKTRSVKMAESPSRFSKKWFLSGLNFHQKIKQMVIKHKLTLIVFSSILSQNSLSNIVIYK